MTLVPRSFHLSWTLSLLKKVFCETGALNWGTWKTLTEAGIPLRSGTKTATEWFLPGDRAKSVTPSMCSLLEGLRRSSDWKNCTSFVTTRAQYFSSDVYCKFQPL